LNEVNYDVIIIGAGMGGLGAGLYLQAKNPKLKSIILEQHSIPGGYVTGFKRKGYYFDGGAEGFSGMVPEGSLRKALKELGFEHDFIRIDPLDVYYYEGIKFSMYNDLKKLLDEVKTNFPEDEKGFREFVEKCFEITHELQEGKEFPEFNNIGFIDFIGKYVKSDYIKDAFNLFSMWYGVPPHELPVTTGASIVYMMINIGVYYPKGGMQAFSDGLTEFYKKNGGEIYFNKMVEKILVENGKTTGVQLEDGTIIKSKWIISNADAKRTILQYTGKEHFSEEFVEFMNDLKVSPTGFMLYLGVDMDLSSYPSHFQIGKDLDIIKKVSEDKFTMEKLAVRIPANIEPALCNEGKYGLVAFIFAPYNWENYWKAGEEKIRGEEYKKLKDEIADEAISIIEKVIPNIREKIEVKELATPLTFERYLQVTDGAWFGSLSFRKKPDMQTPISNLLLVGASVKGSGAPSALRHGLTVGKYILEKIME